MKETCGEHTFQPAETRGVRVRPVVLGEVEVVRTSRGVDVARGRIRRDLQEIDRLELHELVGADRT